MITSTRSSDKNDLQTDANKNKINIKMIHLRREQPRLLKDSWSFVFLLYYYDEFINLFVWLSL